MATSAHILGRSPRGNLTPTLRKRVEIRLGTINAGVRYPAPAAFKPPGFVQTAGLA